MTKDINVASNASGSGAFFKKLFRRRASLDAKKARSGYMFVAPFILGVLLIYLPILIDSVWFSFSNVEFNPSDPSTLILTNAGFEHYKSALNNQSFITALLSGLQQLVFEVPAIIVFSLFIAVVLNQKMLGRAMFRAIFFVPVIISTGIMESINDADMMSGNSGEGIDDGTGGGASDIVSVLDVQVLFSGMKIGGGLVGYVVDLVNNVYNIINYSGVQMLIFLAGLQSISPAIYEACRIDGASGWETFWKVTFPMISPMILVNAVYTIIDSFTRTTNPAMYFINNYNGPNEEVSIAMAWMYFIIVIIIIAVVGAIASSFVFYQRRD
nr:sugar ABC transporter permease [Oscillospiraceae bacterium]